MNGPNPDETEDAPPTSEETADVERETGRLREFIKSLKFEEVKNGDWFAKLLTFSLSTYVKEVNWEFFQNKYKGLPPDAIVDQRIRTAARYGMIEGTLSAGAYTGAIIATIGSVGGASPATVPAAVTTMAVDVASLSQLQLRLAYDIAVLYRVPLDVDDPEDLWKLIRVAFTIKSGELVHDGAAKAVPALVRPLVKRFFSGPVLKAAKGLPVVGKFLLQRNVIKIGIPVVGVPLAAVLNRWTTMVAGHHAQSVFRNDARIMEVADRIVDRTAHPRLLLRVAWLVITSGKPRHKFSDDETLLMRHLTRLIRNRYQVLDEGLERTVDIDVDEVWASIDAETDDLTDLTDAALMVAGIDGPPNKRKQDVLNKFIQRCTADSPEASHEQPGPSTGANRPVETT